MYLSSKLETCPSPVTIVKSHKKTCKNYFPVNSITTISRNVAKCEFWGDWYWAFNRKKWLIFITVRTFKEYIKQNIDMIVLKRENSHSVDISRLIRKSIMQNKIQRKKLWFMWSTVQGRNNEVIKMKWWKFPLTSGSKLNAFK